MSLPWSADVMVLSTGCHGNQDTGGMPQMGPVLLLGFDMRLGQPARPACFQAAGLRERLAEGLCFVT